MKVKRNELEKRYLRGYLAWYQQPGEVLWL
jgi:hypothetical protein